MTEEFARTKDMEDWELRIYDILGEDSERSEENAMRYSSHLTGNLRLQVKVTGREDFPWEEPYVWGGWGRTEYARLKKDNPSYTDSFELLELLPSAENDDVQAKIKRTSDRKVFTIGLSWLQAEDESSKEFTLLDDAGAKSRVTELFLKYSSIQLAWNMIENMHASYCCA